MIIKSIQFYFYFFKVIAENVKLDLENSGLFDE